ncbi:MAG: hypothetical protein M9921_10010 [Fimbriimonadaceae bacterium]|nr:hypothetical protein [Fimbriimonadaceae bacterium]
MRVFLTIALLAAFGQVHARPKFLALFVEHYKVSADSATGAAACRICHTTPPQHNSYGLDLKAALRANNTRELTVAMLASIESKDSDQDGWLNGDEIRQGTLPGDPESHPETPPWDPPADSTTVAPPTPAPRATPSAPPPLIPPHSFHPALVHFPIALFLFGALLDALGAGRRNPTLRQAGFWNMVGGSLATAVVVPTGLAAFLRLGFSFDFVRVHVTLALAATATMAGVVLWRRRGPLSSRGYWLLLALASFLVGATGHFGSAMVFGG